MAGAEAMEGDDEFSADMSQDDAGGEDSEPSAVWR